MSQDVAITAEPSLPAAAGKITRANVGLYLLADHLDAALAAGEDLLACTLTVGAPHSGMAPDDIRAEQAELRVFIDRVRALEMALVSRVLQARRRAGELPRLDDAHAILLNLLLAGTEGLSEAVREVDDRAQQQFLTGTGHLAYLRSRGFLPPEAACLGAIADLRVTEAFLVYGQLPLGGLLDLVASFLDKLDVVFDLYPEPGSDGPSELADEAAIAARMQALQAAADLSASGADQSAVCAASDNAGQPDAGARDVEGIADAPTAAGEKLANEPSLATGSERDSALEDATAAPAEAHSSPSEPPAVRIAISAPTLQGAEEPTTISKGAQSLADALAQIRAQAADKSGSLADRLSRVAQADGSAAS